MATQRDLHTVDPEALQNIPYEMDKKVVDTYVNNMPPKMLSMDDRKTGAIATTATKALQDFAYKPNA